jgi:hypothetical protein
MVLHGVLQRLRSRRLRAALRSLVALGPGARRAPPADPSRPKPTFTYRLFVAGDGPAINAGFNEAFGVTRPLSEWEWKFRPGGASPRIAVAVDDAGGIVAHFGVLPVTLQVDGRHVQAGHCCDLYSLDRPATRSGGVFVRTVRTGFDAFFGPGKLALGFGFPGERALRIGRLKLGYAAPVDVVTWRYAVPARWRLRVPFGRPVSDRLVPAEADALWRRAASRYPVTAVRDAAWLGRRFLSRPGHRYVYVAVGDPLRAWAVVSLAGRHVTWADLLWDGHHDADLRLLHGRVLGLARAAGASALSMWLSNDPAAATVLEREGWRGAPHDKLWLAAVSWDADVDAHRTATRMTITQADGDLV